MTLRVHPYGALQPLWLKHCSGAPGTLPSSVQARCAAPSRGVERVNMLGVVVKFLLILALRLEILCRIIELPDVLFSISV